VENIPTFDEAIISAVEDKEYTKEDVGQLYSYGVEHEQTDGIDHHDWGRINSAIISKWSRSGLHSIKQIAWRVYSERVTP